MKTIGWITHNRRESILRSVESFIDASSNSSQYKLIVSQSGNQDNKEILENLSPNMTVIGNESKWMKDLQSACGEKGIDSSLVQFCLRPNIDISSSAVTTGSNRNTLLLATAGKNFLSADDDILFDIYSSQGFDRDHSPYISHSKFDPNDTFLFKDKKILLEKASQLARVPLEDFIKRHEDSLATRTAVSVSGVWGDSGFSSPRLALALGDETLIKLLKQNSGLETFLTSRILFRQSPSLSRQKISPLMGPCLGFANSEILPPFFPIGRNEDGSYPYVLNACKPDSFITSLDQSIHHTPLETRSYEGSMDAWHIRANDIMILIWNEYLKNRRANLLDQFEESSKYLGSFIQDNFESKIESLVRQNLSQRIINISNQIERIREVAGSDRWINFGLREVELLKKKYEDPLLHVPVEVKCINTFKSWVRDYAHLLSHWRSIYKISQQLEVSGS